jgi:hypothetical protein
MLRRQFIGGVAALPAIAGAPRTFAQEPRLSCIAWVENSTIRRGEAVVVRAVLRCDDRACLVFNRITWGLRGFRVSIQKPDGQLIESAINDFHPIGPGPLTGRGNYIEMETGMLFGAEARLNNFPQVGIYTLRVAYISPLDPGLVDFPGVLTTRKPVFAAQPITVNVQAK